MLREKIASASVTRELSFVFVIVRLRVGNLECCLACGVPSGIVARSETLVCFTATTIITDPKNTQVTEQSSKLLVPLV